MTVLEIKRGIAELPDDTELYIDDGYIKAVDMPIELLKQKLCKEQEIYEKAYKEGCDKGYSDGDFIGANRWIPVSERLPKVMDGSNGECSDDVLICVDDDGQITISTGFYGYYPRSKSQQGWWSVWAYGCNQLDSKYKVIAWMPLPEPYKEEGSES